MKRTCVTCGKSKGVVCYFKRHNRPSIMAECKACFIQRTNEVRRKRQAAAKEKTVDQ